MATQEVKVTITGGAPFGMRIKGGAEFSTSISVENVASNSKAEKAGIKIGDVLTTINGVDVTRMTHEKAKNMIVQSGGVLHIVLKRGQLTQPQPQVQQRPQLQPQQKPVTPATPSPTPAVTSQQPTPPTHKPVVQAPTDPPKKGSVFVVGNPVSSRDDTKYVSSGVKGSGFLSENAGHCYSCKEALSNGSFIKIGDKKWHQEHFTCSICTKNLAGVGFFEEDNKILCRDCYAERFSPRCAHCDKPCIERYVTAGQKSYHPECFKCEKCATELSGKQFNMHEERPHCIDCLSDIMSIKCAGCDGSIRPNEAYVEAQKKQYHNNCFNCHVCDANLADKGKFVIKDGRPSCSNH